MIFIAPFSLFPMTLLFSRVLLNNIGETTPKKPTFFFFLWVDKTKWFTPVV